MSIKQIQDKINYLQESTLNTKQFTALVFSFVSFLDLDGLSKTLTIRWSVQFNCEKNILVYPFFQWSLPFGDERSAMREFRVPYGVWKWSRRSRNKFRYKGYVNGSYWHPGELSFQRPGCRGSIKLHCKGTLYVDHNMYLYISCDLSYKFLGPGIFQHVRRSKVYAEMEVSNGTLCGSYRGVVHGTPDPDNLRLESHFGKYVRGGQEITSLLIQ